MNIAKCARKSDLKPREKQARVRIAVVSCEAAPCASALMQRSEYFDQRFGCLQRADHLRTLTNRVATKPERPKSAIRCTIKRIDIEWNNRQHDPLLEGTIRSELFSKTYGAQ